MLLTIHTDECKASVFGSLEARRASIGAVSRCSNKRFSEKEAEDLVARSSVILPPGRYRLSKKPHPLHKASWYVIDGTTFGMTPEYIELIVKEGKAEKE